MTRFFIVWILSILLLPFFRTPLIRRIRWHLFCGINILSAFKLGRRFYPGNCFVFLVVFQFEENIFSNVGYRIIKFAVAAY